MDTAVLRDLLDHEGPFASVYFDGSHDTEDAGKELELRWRAIREQLVDSRAPDGTVAALDDVVWAERPAVGRAGRFLIAAGNAVPVDEYLPDPPPMPVVRVSRLPYVLPLVTSAPRSVPHVVVQVDKTGATLRAIDEAGAVFGERDVHGHDKPVHKVRGGGWAHRKIQQHTEETVKHNLASVAEETAHMVRETGARLLVLAGDVATETLLRNALPASCAEIAVSVHSGQPTGDEIAKLVEARWVEEHEALMERFRQELNRSKGLAVQGLPEVTAALREANVATLIIDGSGLGDRTVWTGSAPSLVAADPTALMAFGEHGEARADEALPTAAIAVGADIVGDGHGLGDGVGALLRHT